MPAHRGVDAERNAEDQREQRREHGELDRRRQPLDQKVGDRPALAVRDAELSARSVLDEVGELHDYRLVEPESLGELFAVGDRRLLADHVGDRIADEPEHGEGDQRDRQHDDDGLRDAAEEVGDHGLRRLCRTRSPDKLRTRIGASRRPGTGSAQRRSGVQENLAKHSIVRPPQAAATFSWIPDRRSGSAVACPGQRRHPSRLPERHHLEEHLVLRVHRDVEVALHRVREHLVVDRDVERLGAERLPELGDRRVALGKIGLARQRLDRLVGIRVRVPVAFQLPNLSVRVW